MSRCLEPDHRTDFRALLVIHLLQCTTANNRQQKTTFISQFVTQVLPKLSSNFNQGLRVMTRRFCVHLAKSYSAVLQASTTYQLYQISMVWIVKCYQVRSQSLKTTTLGTHAREKMQLWWLRPRIKMISMTFYLFYIKLPPSWPQFRQPYALLKGLSVPFCIKTSSSIRPNYVQPPNKNFTVLQWLWCYCCFTE